MVSCIYFTSISTFPVTESVSFHFWRPHCRPCESKIFINPGAGFFLRTFGGLTFGLDRAIGFKPPRDPNGGVSSCLWAFVAGFLSANSSFSRFVVTSSAGLFGVSLWLRWDNHLVESTYYILHHSTGMIFLKYL